MRRTQNENYLWIAYGIVIGALLMGTVRPAQADDYRAVRALERIATALEHGVCRQ